MGQHESKEYDVMVAGQRAMDEEVEEGGDCEEQAETPIEPLTDGALVDPHSYDDQVQGRRKHDKKKSKKPPAKVRMFADEQNKEVKLQGSVKALEQKKLEQSVREQNFFLEDIVEESGASILPPPVEETSSKSPSKKKNRAPKRRGGFGRKAKTKIVPLIDEDDGNACVSLSNFNAVMVPNDLFDIVIPPPPEFLTPNFVPQEDSEIDPGPDREVDMSVYKHLVGRVLTPAGVEHYGQTEEELITPVQLFNCLNDGQKSPYMFDPTFLLLIDTRTRAQYDEHHVATAHHVLDVQRDIDKFRPVDQYTMIVLYDEDGLQYSLRESDISVAMDLLLGLDADAFVLEGGYKVFNTKFPFWCTSKVARDLKERASLILNLPSIVLDEQLYIGQVTQAISRATVDLLSITHIVCVTQECSMPFADRIQYHHVQLADEPSSKLEQHFADVISFICDAIQNGGRVLVHCNLGQSRSATVVLAYLMFTKRWTLGDAYRYLLDCRPVVRPNEGFMRQLSDLELALFGARHTDIYKSGASRLRTSGIEPESKGRQTNGAEKQALPHSSSQNSPALKVHSTPENNTLLKPHSMPENNTPLKAHSTPENSTPLQVQTTKQNIAVVQPITIDDSSSQLDQSKFDQPQIEVKILAQELKTVRTSYGASGDNEVIFNTRKAHVKSIPRQFAQKNISHCVVKSLDEFEEENFEEEILLSDSKFCGDKNSKNGIMNEAHDERVLSASRDTLDNTIVAI